MSICILKTAKVLVLVLSGLFIIGWLGLQIPSKNFKADKIRPLIYTPGNIEIKIPDELSEYADSAYDGNVQEIDNSVVWGKAKINVKGIWMPARFIAYYIPGEGFFRYIEITWFGIPVINGYDLYYGDRADFCMAGQKETGEKIEQGQNLALWAETFWSPSAYFTDDRLKWRKSDDDVIELIIPYKEAYDTITIYENKDTNLMDSLEAMRYKGQSKDKVLWHIDFIEWNNLNGIMIPSYLSVKWDDEKKPWSFWSIKGILYNIEISDGFEKEINKYIKNNSGG